MKRIKSVIIDNFCAYDHAEFELPNNSNLLIYGENGSGKSSLFRAIKKFFDSSIDSNVTYTKNRYLENIDGVISVKFSDVTYIGSQKGIVSSCDEEYSFSSNQANSTNAVLFIKTAARAKGFLDYTDLLKVYLHSEDSPNLFDLIVLSLLGEHIPLSAGATSTIGQRWKQIRKGLFDVYNRNERSHKLAIRDIPIFETQLRSHLDDVFNELNRLLNQYFGELRINLQYEMKPISFNYGNYKHEWNLNTDLRLHVTKDGLLTLVDYNSVLNEARLSAISLCLYLASLLKMPSAIDCKVLFLDDVFIGLDSGNRLPILNILKTEFCDHQKIISTYDRQWFELAKKYISVNEEMSWSAIEMYSTFDSTLNRPRTIIIKDDSNIDRACRYLYHTTSPDYPAAANYLRKAIEELLSTHLPSSERADGDLIQIPSYKLSLLVGRFSRLLDRLEECTDEIRIIESLLHALLHPLSHHEINSPIYRSELQLIEKAYRGLFEIIKSKDFNNNCRCILGADLVIRLNIKTDIIDYYYELVLEENIILYNSKLREPKCRLRKMYGNKDGKQQNGYTPNKKDSSFHYESLKDLISKICDHLIQQGEIINLLPIDYISMFEYHDGGNWVNLKDKLS